MKMPNYFVFAKAAILFFAISHILSYLVSSLQTVFIVKEIRKGNQSK